MGAELRRRRASPISGASFPRKRAPTPGQGYPVQATTGGVVVTVRVVPEAPTWAMVFAGFAGLCYASLRRSGERTGRGIALS